jgi:putative ABC transport system ATP-binding protein
MFGELHRDGATVVVVTHDPRWLGDAKRQIELFDGKIVA